MTLGWFGYVRSILEVGYFLAGILIAVFAGLGLKQISLTKKIAATNAKRESLKFAAERCQYYANTCVPAISKVHQEHDRLRLTFLRTSLPFSIETQTINKVKRKQVKFQAFDRNAYVAQYDKMKVEIVVCCNEMEAFAIPFAAKVADDELGYQETAGSFCQMVEHMIGMIAILRTIGARYESTLTVYERWKNRLVAESLEGPVRQMQEIQRVAAQRGKVPVDEAF